MIEADRAALLADGALLIDARDQTCETSKEKVKDVIGNEGVTILDVRESRAYSGETPYGESRGGHVPGARHIFCNDLVGVDGRLLTGDALKARLRIWASARTRRSSRTAPGASARALSPRCWPTPGSRPATAPGRTSAGALPTLTRAGWRPALWRFWRRSGVRR